MAQTQFRTTDTDTWDDRFGNGSDGVLSISVDTTEAPIDSACTASANSNSVSATNASFAAGQCILIYQTYGVGAGQWELNKISSYVAGTITTAKKTKYNYVTGAQVRVLRQYSSVSITANYTSKAWDGSVGGILAFLCNGTVTITGAIINNGSAGTAATAPGGLGGLTGGFRGGNGYKSTTTPGTAQGGDGSVSLRLASGSNNGNGGGGGRTVVMSISASGGGGANSATATDGTGTIGMSEGGSGGTSDGISNLTNAVFGGGGGGGAISDSNAALTAGGGGSGGGFVLIIGATISGSGSIQANGGNGTDASNVADGAPGGGGSILLKGQAISGITLSAIAGSASGSSGSASNGRIAADYKDSISVTSTPSISSTQDSTLLQLVTGGAMIF